MNVPRPSTPPAAAARWPVPPPGFRRPSAAESRWLHAAVAGWYYRAAGADVWHFLGLDRAAFDVWLRTDAVPQRWAPPLPDDMCPARPSAR